MRCPEPADLELFLAEELDEGDESRLQMHLDSCSDCQGELERVAGRPAIWSGLREHLSDVDLGEAPDASLATTPEHDLAELVELLDPTDDPRMIGRIGAYEICGLVGRGTTGLVVKALEPRLNRYVAIKLMSPGYRGNGSALRRFEREARAIAAVSHDHVVPIHAVDEHHGLPFIVMKYIPGQSLDQRIEREGPLDTCEVARIGLQVAQGLEAAHAQGVVHRDVKPANVILEDNVERAMVTDFGLARVLDEASMTMSGTISGTPQFMSPEQARGDAVDLRSDLFSLGSLLYTACTGRAPFRAENVYGVIHRVCKTNPRPVREVNPEIDEWLARFVDKLMQKDPDDRFQTAGEVATVLSAELAHLQNPTASAEPPRAWIPNTAVGAHDPGRRGPWARAAIGTSVLSGVLGALAFGAWYLDDGESDGYERAGLMPKQDAPAVAGAPASADSGNWFRMTETHGGMPLAVFEKELVSVFAVEDTGAFRAEVEGADVELVAGEPGRIRIRARRRVSAPDRIAAARFASRFEWDARQEDRDVLLTAREVGDPTDPYAVEEVSYIVELPSAFEPEVVTTHGSIRASGLRGRASLETYYGDVELGAMHGPVWVRTTDGNVLMREGCDDAADILSVRGDLFVANVAGTARLRTSSGTVYLGASTGDVTAQTSGGDVVVEDIAGKVGVHAGGADVHVRLRETPPAGAGFSATAGDVYVAVDESVAATLAAYGEVTSELPFHTERDEEGLPHELVCLNGGGERIVLETTTGRLEVAWLEVEGDRGIATTGGPSAGASPAAGPSGPASPGKAAPARLAETVDGGGSEPSPSGPSLGGSGPSPASPSLGGSGPSKTNPSLGGSGPSAVSPLGGSGPTAASPLGGSGPVASGPSRGASAGAPPAPTPSALAKTTGPPRPGALATVAFEEPIGNFDGFTLYLPVSHADRPGPFPVLLYLQGAYGVGGEVQDLNNWGLPRLLRDETSLDSERNRLLLDEFIVVSMHITGGSYSQESAAVDTVLDSVISRYNGDPTRVSVTGLSRGGHGSWALAHALPDRFAAIAPVGGDAEDVPDFGRLVGPSIWVAHNENDGVVPFSEAASAIAAVEQAAGVTFFHTTPRAVGTTDYLERRHILTSSPTGGHDAWTDLYSHPEFYRWLLRQVREPATEEDARH